MLKLNSFDCQYGTARCTALFLMSAGLTTRLNSHKSCYCNDLRNGDCSDIGSSMSL